MNAETPFKIRSDNTNFKTAVELSIILLLYILDSISASLRIEIISISDYAIRPDLTDNMTELKPSQFYTLDEEKTMIVQPVICFSILRGYEVLKPDGLAVMILEMTAQTLKKTLYVIFYYLLIIYIKVVVLRVIRKKTKERAGRPIPSRIKAYLPIKFLLTNTLRAITAGDEPIATAITETAFLKDRRQTHKSNHLADTTIGNLNNFATLMIRHSLFVFSGAHK